MSTKPHATSEEQIAQLGRVRRKPAQIDLLTGELVTKPPKRGNGRHIALKPIGIEKPVVPGMASYAGEGPQGKRCEDCAYFGEVAVLRPDAADTIEMNREGCLKFASRSGHAAPSVRTSIKYCSACSLFEESTRPAKGNRFIVDLDGEEIRVDEFPKQNLRMWARDRKKGGA